MTVNRNHWKPPFENFPSWLCPTCQSGSLSVYSDTLKITETGPSETAHGHAAWEPDWIEKRFSGLLVCGDAACGELVAIGGVTRFQEFFDLDSGQQYSLHAYEPTFIHPAPPVFPIPKECPEAVAAELRKAFALFWSDVGSGANRLRAATEALLTDKGVARFTINRLRKRVSIALHDRIVKFQLEDPDSADYLLAIKWLGNAGSHDSLDKLKGDDLLDGFELFEHVLERVYVRREKALKRKAKAISARKGRPAKPRRRARRKTAGGIRRIT